MNSENKNKSNEKNKPFVTAQANNAGHTELTTKKTAGSVELRKNKPELERVYTGVDRIFLICVILLVCFGSIMVFSSSYYYSDVKYGDSFYLVKRQIAFAVLGILAMLVVMRMDYKWFKILSIPAYILSMILLALVIVMGTAGGGAQRWLVIPIINISFQPSEFAKLAIVLMLSWYIAKHYLKINDYSDRKSFLWWGIVKPFGLLILLGGAVVLEKHFSGLIIITVISVIIMFAGGSKWNYLFGVCLVFGALIVVAILAMGYSSDRIDSWINPWDDPTGSGWQILQGLKAIGSGGVFGLGLGNSRLKYGYVSMPHNDFIFAIVCEELGYIGALATIALFGVLIWRGFVIASKAPDVFSSLVVIGLTSKVAIQTIFNIAVVTRVIPNTGISLPFFSYGGTALLILMVEMGIILSISKHSYQKKA